jgi:Phytanoyl-CoA dioxygenase (PhyH)
MPVEGFDPLDFHLFHREELGRRLRDGRGRSAGRAAAKLGSLALRLPDGTAYRYVPGDAGIDIVAGDDGATTVIELDKDAWEGLVYDYESAPGLLYVNRVRCRRGDAMRFVHWEPALRRLYTGLEIYDESALNLRDRRGAPLDCRRTFALDEPADDMSHFLRTAGYLLVRRVFSLAEIDVLLGEARELAGEARPGDRLSWWSKDAVGREVLCRVTRAAAKPHLASLPEDARVLGLAGLARTPLVHRDGEGNGVTVIFKNPGIHQGLSDLPWHRDCGLGGHALLCPTVIVSVYLTRATPETGELRFLPGSWNRACAFAEASDPRAPRGISFAAEPGDVSVHFGDVLHAAPPPTRDDLDIYRISAITGFAPPTSRVHRGKSYNEALHRRDDGQIEHLAQVAEKIER